MRSSKPLPFLPLLLLATLSGCHGNPPPQPPPGNPGGGGRGGAAQHLSYMTPDPNDPTKAEVHHSAAVGDTLSWATRPGDQNAYQIHFPDDGFCVDSAGNQNNFTVCPSKPGQQALVTSCTVKKFNDTKDEYYTVDIMTPQGAGCPNAAMGAATGSNPASPATGTTSGSASTSTARNLPRKQKAASQGAQTVSHCNGCVVAPPPPPC